MSDPISDTEKHRRLDAGSFILEERVAEAYEPEWRDLLWRIFIAMRDADLTKNMPKPWET